jgi:hypothetical protein
MKLQSKAFLFFGCGMDMKTADASEDIRGRNFEIPVVIRERLGPRNGSLS